MKNKLDFLLIAAIVLLIALLVFIPAYEKRYVPPAKTPVLSLSATAGQEDLSADDRVTDARAAVDLLRGVWQSVNDESFTREFKKDKTLLDSYSGPSAVSSSGTWKVTDAAADSLGDVGLAISSHGEVFHYGIVKLTHNELELVYLERGGVLRFVRKQ